jgi:hypothetical protein
MSGFEIVSAIIAIIGAVLSVISIVVSSRANNLSNRLSGYYNSLVERNNQFVSGQTELQLSQTIEETKRHLMNVTFKISDLPASADEQVKNMLRSLMKSAMESNVNAYESACGLYLDNKIDTARFKKLYFSEIKRIIEDKTHDDFFQPEGTSKYQAIWKVYREWNILEK